MELNKGTHCVYKCCYHLILTVKYRKKVITDTICNYLKEQFEKLSIKHKIHLIEMEHDQDHIHILFEAKPETQIVSFIMGYKMQTSKGIKQLFPETKQYLWNNVFWGRNYFLATTGGVSLDVLKHYVLNQPLHKKGEKQSNADTKKSQIKIKSV